MLLLHTGKFLDAVSSWVTCYGIAKENDICELRLAAEQLSTDCKSKIAPDCCHFLTNQSIYGIRYHVARDYGTRAHWRPVKAPGGGRIAMR